MRTFCDVFESGFGCMMGFERFVFLEQKVVKLDGGMKR